MLTHLTLRTEFGISCQHAYEKDAWRLANANDGLI